MLRIRWRSRCPAGSCLAAAPALARVLRPLARLTEYMLWTFDDELPVSPWHELEVDKLTFALVRRRAQRLRGRGRVLSSVC